jgi:hypothetical protein
MPTVRHFERCRITMYFSDHAPPHFRVITNSDERVTMIIESLAILAGNADACDIAEALEWAKNNRETLRGLWQQHSE